MPETIFNSKFNLLNSNFYNTNYYRINSLMNNNKYNNKKNKKDKSKYKNFLNYKKANKNSIQKRNGDWLCKFCYNINFSFRTFCNRCKALKK